MMNTLAEHALPRDINLGSTEAFCEGFASPYISHNVRALADSPSGYDGPDDKYIFGGTTHFQGASDRLSY